MLPIIFVALIGLLQAPSSAPGVSELMIERDHHVVKQELRSKVSDFAESYVETARRSNGLVR